MAIAERLLQLRKERGLTLRELAEQVGITAAALSSYEKGKKEPSLEFAIKLAKFYGKSLDNLCGVEDVEQAQSYADLLMFVLKTNASVGGRMRSEGESISSAGSRTTATRSIECMFTSRPRRTELLLRIHGKEVWAFFDTYFKLSTLAENEAIPASVFTNWLHDALANEARVSITHEMTQEEQRQAIDARETGV